MADVWISRKKWTCKYCDVTINDDLASRRHHESGLRHKQNKEKTLQDLYRKGEQERKVAEQTRKEMERIEALAAASYAKDQAGDGLTARISTTKPTTTAASSSTSTAPARSKPPQAQNRHSAKSAGEPKEEALQPVAQAGEWEQVEPAQAYQHQLTASTSFGTETSDRERARSFRVKEKVARIDDSDDENDPARSVIRTKKKPRTGTTSVKAASGLLSSASNVKKEEEVGDSGTVKTEPDASTAPSSSTEPDSAVTAPGRVSAAVKEEERQDDAKVSESVKEERDTSSGAGGAGGGLFKKRRAGAGAGAKRVRAVI
ncbi:hypothetical protein NDA12_003056 [Ustilago hordei]|nr:hypothetical protein NDA12_003056 [Ustilago hordei]KAJ1589562.1 hypothetical protein NDA15_006524 [Ustilago hordei]